MPSSIYDDDKGNVHHVEDAGAVAATFDKDTSRSIQQRWYHRFLKEPPSPEFKTAVAELHDTDLDSDELKRLTRRLDLLICPALAVCYAFYYMWVYI
jgi:hypothetical protein